MARINTYPPDAILQDEDLIIGSDYKGHVNGIPKYETKSFSLYSFANYLARFAANNGLLYNLEDIIGDIGQNTEYINNVSDQLANDKQEILTRISTDISDLEERTGIDISLLDNTLSTAIQGVADTLTTEVGDLNQKILDGDTNLSQDLIDLTGTVTQQASDLTDLINTSIQTTTENLTGEISVVQQAVNNLDTSIGVELGQINLDIAGALQSAIDAGNLATAAQASIDSEIIARADADGAIAARVDTLDTQFEFSTEDGSIVGASGALNQTINTAAATAAGAVATRVDILETEYTIDTEAGTITGFSENSVTNLALTTVTGAVALRVDEIETQFAITDGEITGFSEAAQTRVDQSISDATQAQFLTLDAVKAQFVFSDGNITNVADVLDTSIENRISTATSAQFQKIDEVATQFVFDANGNVEGVQGSISSTIDSSKQEAISAAGIAAQSKVDTFAAKVVTTDANGNVTGLSDAVSTSVSDVVAGDGYASGQELESLRVTVEGADGTGGLTAEVAEAKEVATNVDGRVSASYGLNVVAGDKVAGLQLLADSASPTSQFIAEADIFGVNMPNGTRVLTVDANGLNIVGSGTFTGSLTGASGTFGGVSIGANGITAPGFTLNSDGLETTSGTFTGDFNAGLIEIRSNNIRLKAEPNYGSTGDIEFYNQAGILFGTIQSRSVNIDGTDHDAITIGSPFAGALDTVVIDGQSIIANPADYTNFPTSTGGVQFGNFVTPWEKFSVSATGSIALRTGAAGELFDINSVFLNDGTGPFVSITSRGYVSINAASDINLNPGSGFNVLINGSPIGSTGGTSHPDITAAASVNNSNGTVIQDVTLDSNGHVTGLASVNLDNRYLRTSVSGTVSGTITATDFIVSSDQRLKKDISTYMPDSVNITFREYVFNNDTNRKRVGVIAQELEQNHPEFVITNPETGMKAVSYVDMLVAKVAELEKRINQLENGGA